MKKTARSYLIRRGEGLAGADDIHRLPALAIDCFRPESSSHRPSTSLRLWHDAHCVRGQFQVDDRFVRCRHSGFQQPVYKDSCVELFLQPKPQGGYFNFEFNAGGALLVYWIEDPTREGQGFRRYRVLSDAECARIQVVSSLPARIDPEIDGPLPWSLSFGIPVALLERYAGPIGNVAGQCWRGNAYKCGDETSHPHWASWAPIDRLDFHSPDCFGAFVFE